MPSGIPGTRKPNPAGYIDPDGVNYPIGPGFDLASIPFFQMAPSDDVDDRGLSYGRVSSLAQADKHNPTAKNADEISLPEQIKVNREYCEQHGLRYGGTFWDVKPGPTADRVGYLAMVQQLRASAADVVVVWRSNRLCRGTTGGAPIAAAWEATREGFRVVSVTDYFDMQAFEMINWGAKRAHADITASTSGNRLARARRGEAVSGVYPYWLRRDAPRLVKEDGRVIGVEDVTRPVLVWNATESRVQRLVDGDGPTRLPVVLPAQAAAVHTMLDMYVGQHCTIPEIADWVRENAPEHPNRPCAWNPRTIQNILKEPALVGDHWYSREVYTEDRETVPGQLILRVSDKLDTKKHPGRKNEALRAQPVKQQVPPLIHRDTAERAACYGVGCLACDSEITWESLAAEKLSRNRKAKRNEGASPWPLAKLVYCGVCNTLLTYSTNRWVYHYAKNEDGSSSTDDHGKKIFKKYELKKPFLTLRCGGSTTTPGRKIRCQRGGTAHLRAEEVMAAVTAQIRAVTMNPDHLSQLAQQTLEQIELDRTTALPTPDEATLKQLNADVEGLAETMQKAWQQHDDGKMPDRVYAKLEADLSAQLVMKEELLRIASQTYGQLEARRAVAVDIQGFADSMVDAQRDIDASINNPVTFRGLAQILLEGVTVGADGELTYEWRLKGITEDRSVPRSLRTSRSRISLYVQTQNGIVLAVRERRGAA